MIAPRTKEAKIWWFLASAIVWIFALTSMETINAWTLWRWSVVDGVPYVAFYRFGY